MTTIQGIRFFGAIVPPEIEYYDPDDEDAPDWIFEPQFDSAVANTHSWGPFYFWHGRCNPKQWPVSMALTREIVPPWHRGAGIVLRVGLLQHLGGWGSVAAVGIWWPGRAPGLLSGEPERLAWKKVVQRSQDLS